MPTYYLLFGWGYREPEGGGNDYLGCYPSEKEAREAGLALKNCVHLCAVDESGLRILAEVDWHCDGQRGPVTNRPQWSDDRRALAWVVQRDWDARAAHYHSTDKCFPTFAGRAQPMVVRQEDAEARGMTACPACGANP